MDLLLIFGALFGILLIIKILTILKSNNRGFVSGVVSGAMTIIDKCCGSHRRDFT